MPLTLIDRAHLQRLLELARTSPEHADIVAAYTLPPATVPAGNYDFDPLRDANGEPVTDETCMQFNWGDTRIQFFPSSGDFKTAKPHEPIRLNNWILQCRIDGKWMTAMNTQSVEIPKLDYGTDGIMVLKIKSYAYANGPTWVDCADKTPRGAF